MSSPVDKGGRLRIRDYCDALNYGSLPLCAVLEMFADLPVKIIAPQTLKLNGWLCLDSPVPYALISCAV